MASTRITALTGARRGRCGSARTESHRPGGVSLAPALPLGSVRTGSRHPAGSLASSSPSRCLAGGVRGAVRPRALAVPAAVALAGGLRALATTAAEHHQSERRNLGPLRFRSDLSGDHLRLALSLPKAPPSGRLAPHQPSAKCHQRKRHSESGGARYPIHRRPFLLLLLCLACQPAPAPRAKPPPWTARPVAQELSTLSNHGTKESFSPLFSALKSDCRCATLSSAKVRRARS